MGGVIVTIYILHFFKQLQDFKIIPTLIHFNSKKILLSI